MKEGNTIAPNKIARIDVRVCPDIKNEFSEICLNDGFTTSEAIRDFVHNKVHDHNKNMDTNAHGNKKNDRYYLLAIVFSLIALALTLLPDKPTSAFQVSAGLNTLFNRIDKDKNGSISLHDLQAHKANMVSNVKKGVGPIHKVKNRRITLTEVDILFNPLTQFAEWDLNHDQKLSINEFAKSYYPFRSKYFFPRGC